MRLRNASRNPAAVTIDCELEHPLFGWIPFTAAPDDPEPLGREVYARIVDGEAGAVAQAAPPDPGQQRGAAAAAIDRAAEQGRLRHLTPGAGQALTYLEKERDARAYAAAGYPEARLAGFLFVDAERRAMGITGREAAELIIAAAGRWRARAAAIDHARRKGKLAVAAAADVPAIARARDEALAALAAL